MLQGKVESERKLCARYPRGRLEGNDDPWRQRAHDDGDGEQGRQLHHQHQQHQLASSQFKFYLQGLAEADKFALKP